MSEQDETQSAPPNGEDDSSKFAKILALEIEQFPEFRQSPAFAWQRDGARYALHSVQQALREGHLTLADFVHVVDFGAGGGGPTFFLDQICKITGGKVEAFENDASQLEQYNNVVPLVPVFTGNGIEELPKRSGVSLITTFTFGPDYDGRLFPLLAKAASHALTPEGKLLIFSDYLSEKHIHNSLVRMKTFDKYVGVVKAQNSGDTYRHIPQTTILSRQGASLIK